MRWIWLVALGLGCGARGAQNIDPTPPWATERGRVQANTALATALLDSGNPEAALRLIGKMTERGAKTPELQVIQGKAMAQLGLVDDAETVLTQVARRHPGQSEAHNQLGILLMDARRVEEAIVRFRAATRAAPRDGNAQNNLGFALMAGGRYEEAIKVLRKALTLGGSQARIRNNLGFALVATKRDTAAFRVFRASVDPATAHTNLALAQELRGDLDAATASYGRALAANPDHAAAKDALQRLQAPPANENTTPQDKRNTSEVLSPPMEKR